jgi:hypothetical protein
METRRDAASAAAVPVVKAHLLLKPLKREVELFGPSFVVESIPHLRSGKSLIVSSGLDGLRLAGDLWTIRDIQIHAAADWTPGKDDPDTP